jgi:hypothetical protein
MCLGPELALGLALSGAGSYLQNKEQNKNSQKQTDAKNLAYQQNIARSNQYAADAGSIQANNTKTQGRENFDIQKNQEAQKSKELFNTNRTQPDYNVGLSANTPKNVVIARQQASEDAAAKTDRDVENNAALQGYGGALFNTGLGQSEFARLFGGIQDKAAANTRLLPLEMSSAVNNAPQKHSIFPTLLKAAGTGLSMYAGAGGSFTGTAPGSFSSMAPGMYGPPAPLKAHGLFMNNEPLELFNYKLAGRYT